MLAEANTKAVFEAAEYPHGAQVVVQSVVKLDGAWFEVRGSERPSVVVAPETLHFTPNQLSGVGCLAVQACTEAASTEFEDHTRIIPVRHIYLSGEVDGAELTDTQPSEAVILAPHE